MSERRRRCGIGPGRRPLACYHEAGHCLVRWYFGHSFDRVLVLTMDEMRRGVQPVNRRGELTGGAEGFVDCYDLVSPALDPGMLASMGGKPEEVDQLRSSTQIAIEQELMDCYAGMMAEARYRKCGLTAAMFLGGGGDMKQALSVLDTWFFDASLRKQAAILAERRTAALVRSKPGWAAITVLADALQERGEVSWEDADLLFAAAYRHEQPGMAVWLEAWPPSLDMIRAGRVPSTEAPPV